MIFPLLNILLTGANAIFVNKIDLGDILNFEMSLNPQLILIDNTIVLIPAFLF